MDGPETASRQTATTAVQRLLTALRPAVTTEAYTRTLLAHHGLNEAWHHTAPGTASETDAETITRHRAGHAQRTLAGLAETAAALAEPIRQRYEDARRTVEALAQGTENPDPAATNRALDRMWETMRAKRDDHPALHTPLGELTLETHATLQELLDGHRRKSRTWLSPSGTETYWVPTATAAKLTGRMAQALGKPIGKRAATIQRWAAWGEALPTSLRSEAIEALAILPHEGWPGARDALRELKTTVAELTKLWQPEAATADHDGEPEG